MRSGCRDCSPLDGCGSLASQFPGGQPRELQAEYGEFGQSCVDPCRDSLSPGVQGHWTEDDEGRFFREEEGSGSHHRSNSAGRVC
jgi:hypothetical protein